MHPGILLSSRVKSTKSRLLDWEVLMKRLKTILLALIFVTTLTAMLPLSALAQGRWYARSDRRAVIVYGYQSRPYYRTRPHYSTYTYRSYYYPDSYYSTYYP